VPKGYKGICCGVRRLWQRSLRKGLGETWDAVGRRVGTSRARGGMRPGPWQWAGEGRNMDTSNVNVQAQP